MMELLQNFDFPKGGSVNSIFSFGTASEFNFFHRYNRVGLDILCFVDSGKLCKKLNNPSLSNLKKNLPDLRLKTQFFRILLIC